MTKRMAWQVLAALVAATAIAAAVLLVVWQRPRQAAAGAAAFPSPASAAVPASVPPVAAITEASANVAGPAVAPPPVAIRSAAATTAPGPAQAPAAPGRRIEQLRASLRQRSPESLETLTTALADPNAILRAEAAGGLGDYAGDAAYAPPPLVSALEQALDDPYPAVVIKAAQSLARFRVATAEPRLLKLLAASRQRLDGYGLAIRIASLDALGACAAPRSDAALQALGAELARHEDLSQDNAAVKALGGLAQPAAVPLLEAHLRRLEGLKPDEPIALHAWQEAVAVARDALKKYGVATE